ncbi:hypothetical protein [Streptomyces sp. MN13]
MRGSDHHGECSICHHPGAHAVVIPREGWPTRCGDFEFTAAPGTTDDARIRDITQALLPVFADRLFTAREQGATE